jgi:hypothetical protein
MQLDRLVCQIFKNQNFSEERNTEKSTGSCWELSGYCKALAALATDTQRVIVTMKGNKREDTHSTWFTHPIVAECLYVLHSALGIATTPPHFEPGRRGWLSDCLFLCFFLNSLYIHCTPVRVESHLANKKKVFHQGSLVPLHTRIPSHATDGSPLQLDPNFWERFSKTKKKKAHHQYRS